MADTKVCPNSGPVDVIMPDCRATLIARSSSLVVIPRLDEFNPVGKHPIDNAMFLANSPGPAAGEVMPEWFGLANSLERIGKNCRHQVENPQRGLAVCLNPAP